MPVRPWPRGGGLVHCLLGHDDQVSRQALASLWDEAFGQGRLAALDELQDRFCVCMK